MDTLNKREYFRRMMPGLMGELKGIKVTENGYPGIPQHADAVVKYLHDFCEELLLQNDRLSENLNSTYNISRRRLDLCRIMARKLGYEGSNLEVIRESLERNDGPTDILNINFRYEREAWSERLDEPIRLKERLAFLDYSESYEMDEYQLWELEDGRIMLVHRIGCSCYDDETDAEIEFLPSKQAGLEKVDAVKRQYRSRRDRLGE